MRCFSLLIAIVISFLLLLFFVGRERHIVFFFTNKRGIFQCRRFVRGWRLDFGVVAFIRFALFVAKHRTESLDTDDQDKRINGEDWRDGEREKDSKKYGEQIPRKERSDGQSHARRSLDAPSEVRIRADGVHNFGDVHSMSRELDERKDRDERGEKEKRKTGRRRILVRGGVDERDRAVAGFVDLVEMVAKATIASRAQQQRNRRRRVVYLVFVLVVGKQRGHRYDHFTEASSAAQQLEVVVAELVDRSDRVQVRNVDGDVESRDAS